MCDALNVPSGSQTAHWIAGIAVVLLVAGIVFPLAILPQANPDQLPQGVNLDPIFLFFIPNSRAGNGRYPVDHPHRPHRSGRYAALDHP